MYILGHNLHILEQGYMGNVIQVLYQINYR